MQTNKEQNQSDITAINPDFLPKEYTIEVIRNFEPQLADWIEQRIHQAEIDARINSLLDLEKWAKLHDLDAEQIYDGIEHMVKSLLTVPNQKFTANTDRIAELERGSES